MENLPAENVEVDDNGRQDSQDCLGLPTILRKILENFSSKELLGLSLVNKQWNYEARCVLRDRGTQVAYISREGSRRDIVELASDLEKMHVTPFCGIHIELYRHHLCQSLTTASQLPACNTILERLPCKTLTVEFRNNWDKCQDCPALAIVQRILEECSQVLEDLSFCFDFDLVEPFEQVFQPRTFPQLRNLKLATRKTELLQNLAKVLVSCAPNLVALHVEGDLNFNENVLEGSSAVLVPSLPWFDFNPLYGQVCESLVGALRPKAIEIQPRELEHFNEELLDRYVPMVLEAARTTIQTMTMDLLYVVPLMASGICFENVTELNICVHDYSLDSNFSKFLAAFDFTRGFPKLNQVRVLYDVGRPFELDHIYSSFEQALEVFSRGPLPDRAINIKHLTLGGPILNSTVPFLAKMFPHVKAMTVNMTANRYRDVFTRLWRHFNCLMELEFNFRADSPTTTNLDSVFCGIFPEEIAELREKDDQYFQAVHIVPVMPSIKCMSDLRSLTLGYEPDEMEPYMPSTSDPSILLTKVTDLIGFARCPGLGVTTRKTGRKAPEDEKPFVICL